jgi:hypothetical protein
MKAKAIAMTSAAAGAVAVFRSSITDRPLLSLFNGARDIRDLYAIVINQASINFEL